jgi:hypothetical protein
MVHAQVVPDYEPVEEVIELAGTLPAGARVPKGHFGLVLAVARSAGEGGVGRYVRAGEVAGEACELYRFRRRR